MDPTWINAGSQVLSAAIKAGAQPAGPSNALGSAINNGDGWVVNFGAGTASSTMTKGATDGATQLPNSAQTLLSTPAAQTAGYGLLGVLALLLLIKKAKG